MKIFSISSLMVAITISNCECFNSHSRQQRHSRVTTPWSSRRSTCVIPSSSSSSCSSPRLGRSTTTTALFGSADALLKMVEEVAEGQFSPQVVEKMSELEQALTMFLEEEKRAAQQNSLSGGKLNPRPPLIPPPLQSFIQQGETRAERDYSLQKAEKALETLRQRLRREEETLRKAEEALHQSMEEQEVLRRAEEALAKSRAAAEERRDEAIRRTQEAVASAEQARKEKQEAEQFAIEQGLVVPEVPVEQQQQQAQAPQTDVAAAAASRPTISLDALGGNNNELVNDEPVPPISPDAPPGVPALYDWIQYIDGSITGRVKGSLNFSDGSQVSTSPVPEGARGGMVITTQSGSRYYLERVTSSLDGAAATTANSPQAAEQTNGWGMTPTNGSSAAQEVEQAMAAASQSSMGIPQNSTPKSAVAPPGIPSILNWELLEDGGISGLIFGSPNADDGDYVETSPIAHGLIDSGCVVQTSSGSSYFLSPDQTDREENALAAFKDLAAARRGSTITITKDMKEQQAQNAMEKLRETPAKRSTFSLGDLFGGKDLNREPRPTIYRAGVPTLSKWNTNNDGSITGLIYGAEGMNDGDLITTSPIAEGDFCAGGMVTTMSGSVYYLE